MSFLTRCQVGVPVIQVGDFNYVAQRTCRKYDGKYWNVKDIKKYSLEILDLNQKVTFNEKRKGQSINVMQYFSFLKANTTEAGWYFVMTTQICWGLLPVAEAGEERQGHYWETKKQFR